MQIYYSRLPNQRYSFLAFLSEEEEFQIAVTQWLHQFNIEVIEFEMGSLEDLEEEYIRLTRESTVFYRREDLTVFFSNSKTGFEQETSIEILAVKLLEGRASGVVGFNSW